MCYFVVILTDYSTFHHSADMVWFPTPGLWRRGGCFFFEVLIVVYACVGFSLSALKYSRDDRRSIYLDVYCFWTAWHTGDAWAGIHMREEALFEQAILRGGKNDQSDMAATRRLWMVPLWASDERETEQFKCFKSNPGTSSIRKHGVCPPPPHTIRLRPPPPCQVSAPEVIF